ncbi:hypothetical protein [Methylobacterium tarhaniae]|uniref:hypothetical protein n=1 Tax=Methylobacterium tarhaniae TaxID=1187852 RepID=UPI000AE35BA2|nr:hypothetical protein [Methylobacterium tarhaniae]
MDRPDRLRLMPIRLDHLAAELSNASAADDARFGNDIQESRVVATSGLHATLWVARHAASCAMPQR